MALAPGGYDSFLDFSTGFWTHDLDTYVAALAGAGHRLVPVEWEQVRPSTRDRVLLTPPDLSLSLSLSVSRGVRTEPFF